MNWIKCSERLPEKKLEVLCFDLSQGYWAGYRWTDDSWVANTPGCTGSDCYPPDAPTHWMPLPNKPTTGK